MSEEILTPEFLLEHILEHIYMLSIQPLSLPKLSNFYEFCGQGSSLEKRCDSLGYYSLNHLIRENKDMYESWLDIFVSKENNSYVIYYHNREHGQKESYYDKKVIDQPHVKITIEQTNFFEYHNSPNFIEGRRLFFDTVKCWLENNPSHDFVPIIKLQEAFPVVCNMEYQVFLKKHFPNAGKLEKLVRKILFEEIDFEYGGGQQMIFKIKDGVTKNDLILKLNTLKHGYELISKAIEHALHSYRPHHKHARNNYYNHQKPINNVAALPQTYRPQDSPSENFPASDDEDFNDYRIENQPEEERSQSKQTENRRRQSEVSKKTQVNGSTFIKPEIKQFKKIDQLYKEYKIVDDENLDELFLKAVEVLTDTNDQQIKIKESDNNIQKSGLDIVHNVPTSSKVAKPSNNDVSDNPVSSKILEDVLYTSDEEDESKDEKNNSYGNIKDESLQTTTFASKPQEQKNNVSSQNDLQNAADMSDGESYSSANETMDSNSPALKVIQTGPRPFQFLRGEPPRICEMTKEEKEKHRRMREAKNATTSKRDRSSNNMPSYQPPPPPQAPTVVSPSASAASSRGFSIPHNLPTASNSSVSQHNFQSSAATSQPYNENASLPQPIPPQRYQSTTGINREVAEHHQVLQPPAQGMNEQVNSPVLRQEYVQPSYNNGSYSDRNSDNGNYNDRPLNPREIRNARIRENNQTRVPPLENNQVRNEPLREDHIRSIGNNPSLVERYIQLTPDERNVRNNRPLDANYGRQPRHEPQAPQNVRPPRHDYTTPSPYPSGTSRRPPSRQSAFTPLPPRPNSRFESLSNFPHSNANSVESNYQGNFNGNNVHQDDIYGQSSRYQNDHSWRQEPIYEAQRNLRQQNYDEDYPNRGVPANYSHSYNRENHYAVPQQPIHRPIPIQSRPVSAIPSVPSRASSATPGFPKAEDSKVIMIKRMVQEIRRVMASKSDGYVEIPELSEHLEDVGLPPHPNYVYRTYGWSQFVREFMSGEFQFRQYDDMGAYLIDPSKCTFDY